MAIYIAIEKIEESTTKAKYRFFLTEETVGELVIEKAAGKVQVIKNLKGELAERHTARVIHKVKKHWQAGTYPEKTCWAS